MPSSRPRRKTKRTKLQPGIMKPTSDPWFRERYQKRVLSWLWRLRPYALKMIEDQCGSCQMNGRCNRVPLDPKITAKILKGEGCPDQKSLWKGILNKNTEPYDWGF